MEFLRLKKMMNLMVRSSLFPIKSKIKNEKSFKNSRFNIHLGNNRHPLETVIASSSNPAQITRYNPDYESILESKRRQSNLTLFKSFA